MASAACSLGGDYKLRNGTTRDHLLLMGSPETSGCQMGFYWALILVKKGVCGEDFTVVLHDSVHFSLCSKFNKR